MKIGDHLWLNLSRRSQCDNCLFDICLYNDGSRVEECPHYVPRMAALKMCHRCGGVFEVTSNFRGLDYDLCPECNLHVLAHG